MSTTKKDDLTEQSGMNVFAEENKDEDLKKEENNLSPDSSAAPVSPDSTMQAPSAQKAPTSGQSNAQSAGGSGSGTFTNLAKYRQANKPAAKGIADAVTKGSQNKAGEIGQAVQQQKSQFQSQVDANRARMEAASNFANNQFEAANSGQMNTAEDTKRFQDTLNKQNQFNQATANYTPQEQQISNMTGTTQDANRQDARMQLLKQTFGGQDAYTAGQQNLDDLIVSGDEAARTQIAQAPQQAVQGLQDQIQQAKQYTLAEKDALRQEEDMLKSDLQSRLESAEQEISDARAEDQARFSGLTAGSNFTQEDLDILGREEGFDQLWGADIGGLIEGGITPEQLQRLNALNNLQGKVGSGLSESDFYNTDRLEHEIAVNKEAAYEGVRDYLKNLHGSGSGVANIENRKDAQYLASLLGAGNYSQKFLDSSNMNLGTPEDQELRRSSRQGILDEFGDAGYDFNFGDGNQGTYGFSDLENVDKYDTAEGLREALRGYTGNRSFDNTYTQPSQWNQFGNAARVEGRYADIKNILDNYNLNQGVGIEAEEGGVKEESPRLASIKKLLGY